MCNGHGIAVLDMASAFNPGGGYERGAGTCVVTLPLSLFRCHSSVASDVEEAAPRSLVAQPLVELCCIEGLLGQGCCLVRVCGCPPAGAQEEDLCRRSTLVPVLLEAKRRGITGSTLAYHEFGFPLLLVVPTRDTLPVSAGASRVPPTVITLAMPRVPI